MCANYLVVLACLLCRNRAGRLHRHADVARRCRKIQQLCDGLQYLEAHRRTGTWDFIILNKSPTEPMSARSPAGAVVFRILIRFLSRVTRVHAHAPSVVEPLSLSLTLSLSPSLSLFFSSCVDEISYEKVLPPTRMCLIQTHPSGGNTFSEHTLARRCSNVH